MGRAPARPGCESALYGILQASVATRPQAAARLLHHRERRPDRAGRRCRLAAAAPRPAAGASADVALAAALLLVVSHAAFKTVALPRRRVGPARHRRARPRPARRAGPADAGHRRSRSASAPLGAAALPVTRGFVAEWVAAAVPDPRRRPRGPARRRRPAARGRRGRADRRPGPADVRQGLRHRVPGPAPRPGAGTRPRGAGHDAGRAARRRPPSVLALGLVARPARHRRSPARSGPAASTPVGLARPRSPGRRRAARPGRPGPARAAGRSSSGASPWSAGRVARPARAGRPRRGAAAASGSSPRMQYTATSYAEPLVRVFDDALRPARDLEVTHGEESRYLIERVSSASRSSDVVEVPALPAGASAALAGSATLRATAAERQHPPLPRLLLRRPGRRPRRWCRCEPAAAARRSPSVQIVVVAAVCARRSSGVMRQVRARLEGRAGAGVCSPGATCASWLGKEPLPPTGTLLVAAMPPSC